MKMHLGVDIKMHLGESNSSMLVNKACSSLQTYQEQMRVDNVVY